MSLAENWVIANQLSETVVGKRITGSVVNQNPHTFVWFATEPRDAFCDHQTSNANALEYEALLVGQTLERSEVRFGAYGAYNFLYLGERALMFNLPVSYYSRVEKPPKRHQLLLTLDDGASLAFCASLGGPLFLFRIDGDGLAADYKPGPFPSVLSDDFSQDYFMTLIRETDMRSLSAKQFLATKNRIPGLDNFILHEILWEARVNPKSKMAALDGGDYASMYDAIKRVFPAVIAAGGRDTEKDLYGEPGGYVTKASRNTLGKPCARCGEAIVKESYLGGVVYYCPQCQPVRLPSKPAK